MHLLQNVFRAACDGHTHMDDFKISYVLYLTKASGIIFQVTYYIENGSVVLSSGMAWFLSIDADTFVFNEIEATAK